MVTRVMAQGVFDIMHLGHVHYLAEAKKLGDELVVVVARDSTVRKLKHEPVTSEEMRREMIEALKPVDKAVLGDENDRYATVVALKPDIIALGYDQEIDEVKLAADLAERGLENIKVVRLPKFDSDLNGTRKIIRKIIDYWDLQKKLDKVEKPLKFHPRKDDENSGEPNNGEKSTRSERNSGEEEGTPAETEGRKPSGGEKKRRVKSSLIRGGPIAPSEPPNRTA